jgi:hypothetical protein
MLVIAVDLFTYCGLFACDMDNWDQKRPISKKNLFGHFIQDSYQCHLASGTITSAQEGYSNNLFASIAAADDISDNDTSETITDTINLHTANLSASFSKHTFSDLI